MSTPLVSHALVTLGEAREALDDEETDDDRLRGLINRASDFIETWTGRALAEREHFERFVRAGADGMFSVKQWPVTSVVEAIAGHYSALDVRNTSDDHVRATVTVRSDEVELTHITDAGVTNTSTIARAGKTLSELQNDINAVGDGWEARGAQRGMATDLWETTPVNARRSWARIRAAMRQVGTEIIRADVGILGIAPISGEEAIRIRYIAGYDPIPHDLRGATIMVVKAILERYDSQPIQTTDTQTDGTSFSVGDYSRSPSVSTTTSRSFDAAIIARLPEEWLRVLDSYKRFAVGVSR